MPKLRTWMTGALAGAVAAGCLLIAPGAWAAPAACTGGRYLLDRAPLAVGTALPGLTTVSLSNGAVELDGACPAVEASTLKGVRVGRQSVTRLRAVWRGCGAVRKQVGLRAKISSDCRRIRGKIRVGRQGARRSFTGHLSECGDGIVDAGGGETCDPNASSTACGELQACADSCTCTDLIQACVPRAQDGKPKTSEVTKLERILADANRSPSVLLGAYLRMARRFTLGYPAADALEERVFAAHARLSASGKGILGCTLANFERLPASVRERLVPAELSMPADQPLSLERIKELWLRDTARRVSLDLTGDPTCAEGERPGTRRPRTQCDMDGCVDVVQPVVCRFEEPDPRPDVRTGQQVPLLSLAEFQRHELEQTCVLDQNNVQLCDNQIVQSSVDCPGRAMRNGVEFLCLAVPRVRAGSAVVLGGFNFASTGATVTLTPKGGGVSRSVDAAVCGDSTPHLESAADCTVHDHLTFTVPDVPEGIYRIRVVVPGADRPSAEEYIWVLPPTATRYGISTEKVRCIEETDGPGDDEVGIRFRSVPILSDGSLGAIRQEQFLWDGVESDADNDRRLQLFAGADLSVLAISVLGHEIDSDRAYREMTTEFDEAFEEYLSSIEGVLLGPVLHDTGQLVGAAIGGPVGAAIGALVGDAINATIGVFYALWAPPDLIIEDTLTFTAEDLATLTKSDLPLPQPIPPYRTPHQIRVEVQGQNKLPGEYRESHKYTSDDEGSRYRINFEVERLP
ncbi:MAG: hypothetical protein U0807_05590 [Candidatus Binatia bacterium]